MLRADGDVGASLLAAARGCAGLSNFVALSRRKRTAFSRCAREKAAVSISALSASMLHAQASHERNFAAING